MPTIFDGENILTVQLNGAYDYVTVNWVKVFLQNVYQVSLFAA